MNYLGCCRKSQPIKIEFDAKHYLDRQYIYVNRRPCDHSKLTKLVNEMFHKFNRNQYPMFVLNINMASNYVDVNVTPDKLQMFIRGESGLLAIVKSSLHKMYKAALNNMNLNDSSFHAHTSAASGRSGSSSSKASSTLMSSFLSSSFSNKSSSGGSSSSSKVPIAPVDSDDDNDDEGKKTSKEKQKSAEVVVVETKRTLPSKRRAASDNDDDNDNADDSFGNKTPKATGASTLDNDDDDISSEGEERGEKRQPQAKRANLCPPKPATNNNDDDDGEQGDIFLAGRRHTTPQKKTAAPTATERGVQLQLRISPDANHNKENSPTAASTDKDSTATSASSTKTFHFEMYVPPKRTTAVAATATRTLDDTLFPVKDKLSMFQNRIGSSDTSKLSSTRMSETSLLLQSKADAASAFDDSVAERLDLHFGGSMRNDSIESPVVTSTRRRSQQDDDDDCESDFAPLATKPKEAKNKSKQPAQVVTSRAREVEVEAVEPPSQTQTQTQSQTESQSTQVSINLDEIVRRRPVKTLSVDMAALQRQHDELIAHNARSAAEAANERELIAKLRFKTKNIESKEAESELDRCITKQDFLRMRVCGQFNKGFILAQLDHDLFIVDQHAADEIYNFETLQRDARIEKQRLLQPKYLELTVRDRAVILEKTSTVHLKL